MIFGLPMLSPLTTVTEFRNLIKEFPIDGFTTVTEEINPSHAQKSLFLCVVNGKNTQLFNLQLKKLLITSLSDKKPT